MKITACIISSILDNSICVIVEQPLDAFISLVIIKNYVESNLLILDLMFTTKTIMQELSLSFCKYEYNISYYSYIEVNVILKL